MLDHAGGEQEPSQIQPCGREAGIDAKRLRVVVRGDVGTVLTLGEHTQTVMGLGDIGIEAARALQQLAGTSEVAALHLDQRLIRQRLDEARAVLERQGKAGIGRFEIPGGQSLDTGPIELGGLGRQRRRSAASHQR